MYHIQGLQAEYNICIGLDAGHATTATTEPRLWRRKNSNKIEKHQQGNLETIKDIHNNQNLKS